MPFKVELNIDSNRYSDGLNLRYIFCEEIPPFNTTFLILTNDKPCSVLEMMIALAIRMNNSIVHDNDISYQTGILFWDMIRSMNLLLFDDIHYDEDAVFNFISNMMTRNYEPNGSGGLFTVLHPKRDMREVEIWCQAMWYLNDISNR